MALGEVPLMNLDSEFVADLALVVVFQCANCFCCGDGVDPVWWISNLWLYWYELPHKHG